MKLIALLIGLLVERLATQLFHLRRLHKLDQVIDSGFRLVSRASPVPVILSVCLLAVALVAPVLLVMLWLDDALYGFGYLLIAVVVLFFSLGPQDLGEQVDEYCAAVEAEDESLIQSSAKALTETSATSDPEERIGEVEAAVCVQANNRLFAVIFWFVLFGPLGAWAYRVTDLIRRRAVFELERQPETSPSHGDIVAAATALHAVTAWVPARLTAVGFALAGNFDGATAAWRADSSGEASGIAEQNEELLARIGVAALALHPLPEETTAERAVRGAVAAKGLVLRLLGIWAVVIAAMTLYGASL